MKDKGSSQKDILKWGIYHYSTAMNSINLPVAYLVATMHAESSLGMIFQVTAAGISHDMPLLQLETCSKRTVLR